MSFVPSAKTPPFVPGLRVGLFGGSFNPPHNGHREASLLALRRLQLHRIWWLVSPANPLKDPHELAPLAERVEAARELGRLVALNGTEGTIACRVNPGDGGEHWSVGHLITIVHQASRLVGVVCELATADRLWSR